MRLTTIKLIASLLLTFLGVNLFAQQMQPIPIDPQVRYGKLDNGLTYYIRHNENPKERAEFYIAQNVGAILENDDQDGLAHFLEHMAFNGTKNYPNKNFLEYFESIGVKFGYNINAYTSLDETVYNLSNVPTTRAGVVDSALLILHDWSSFIALEAQEIDSERGVILEEWRTRTSDASRRMWAKSNLLKYPGSQYAKRDVIGDTAVIKNFDHKALRDFYHKWYGPDLQAILIVGDVNVDEIENKIKTLFADVPRRENFGERPIYPIGNNEEPIIAIVTDKEAPVTRLQIDYKHDILPAEVTASINGYMVQTVNSLISVMQSYRFSEIAQQADAPFVGAYAYYGELVRSKDAFTMLAVPKEGKELEGLQALLLETEKLKRFGFTNSELERAKIDFFKSIEKSYNERNNQENNNLVREYVRNYMDNEPIPGIEWEYEFLKATLPQLNVDMVNQVVKSYITDNNVIVTITAPEKAEVIVPSEEKILAAISSTKDIELTAPKEEDMNMPLIKQMPKVGKIKKTAKKSDLGITEWTLSNGVKVIFKPTDFKQDEILMSAFSEGGISKVDNIEDLPSAMFSTSIVGGNGLGEYNSIDLEKALTGKIANVRPYIDSYEEGFSGSSSVTDFETMMQLLYLNFTAPRKDDNTFQVLLNRLRVSYANKDKNPQAAFSDSVNVMMSNHNPRSIIIDLNTLDKINQDKALAIFKERFANPADFTFVFTGNIDPNDAATQKTICTYLGGLKTKKGKEKYTDRGIRRPQGEVENYFKKEMQITKASNLIVYTVKIAYNLQNRTTIRTIGDILNIRYLESIREKEGGSYGVGVRGSVSNQPIEQGTLLMQFDTDAEKQEKLMSIIHAELKEIADNGPRADDLQKVKENLLKQLQEDLRENSWWKNALNLYYQDNINLIKDYKGVVDALNADAVQKLAKEILDQNNVIEIVMLPVVE